MHSDWKNSLQADQVAREYESELQELTFNSKPLINSLTIIAGENPQHAKEIVRAISKRIQTVRNFLYKDKYNYSLYKGRQR